LLADIKSLQFRNRGDLVLVIPSLTFITVVRTSCWPLFYLCCLPLVLSPFLPS
jgi:hypothetical protein